MKKKLTIVLSFFVISFGVQSQPDGKYTGNIDILGRQIGIEMEFEKMNPVNKLKGSISIPSQGAFNLLLKFIEFAERKVVRN